MPPKADQSFTMRGLLLRDRCEATLVCTEPGCRGAMSFEAEHPLKLFLRAEEWLGEHRDEKHGGKP